ncbi:LysR substrate-binding domain-containing protein [Enterocloster asparagiformis]|uniref:LysR substrate-binding domain-containing protein n=1 Tax=Enterocloster asparagiformis TaxID=333367 RepID=UPI003AB96B10
MLPDVMVKKELAEGSLLRVPLASPIPLRYVNLLFRSDLNLPAASRIFVTYLKEHFGSLQGS